MEKRASGVLMHITSLPGKQGVGTFGQEAYNFVDFLVETDQTYWQILPLTTTSYGDSPYQSFSATAGNTHLIDLELLCKQGYLAKEDFETVNFGDDLENVDYARIFEARRPILEKAVAEFMQNSDNQKALAEFEKEASWVKDYAEFMAIKEFFGNKALQEWDDKAVVRREEAALDAYREKLKDAITYHKVTQYFFYQQWADLVMMVNFGEIQFMIGKTTRKQIMLGGFTVLKRGLSSTTFFVLTTLKVSQIIGKFVAITKLQMMVAGNLVQDALCLMSYVTSLANFLLLQKTSVILMPKLSNC